MDNEFQIMRVLAHGQLQDLSQGFKRNSPFSVYIRAKTATLERDVLVNCKCISDKEISPLPCPIGDWTPGAIVELAPNSIDLSVYDVYWGGANEKF